MASERGRSSGSERSSSQGSSGSTSVANITHHLKGIDYPTDKDGILKQAKQNGADRDVLDALDRIADKEYVSMADLMKEYGKEH